MQTHHLILLVLGLAVLWGFCVLARANDAVDQDAHVSIGQISPEEDAFHHKPLGAPDSDPACQAGLETGAPAKHFITVCCYCHGIYSIEGHWRTCARLRIRDTLKVSHGICPDCEPGVQAALDRDLAALSPNSELRTPNSEPALT